jgi:hypothetical protein
VHLEMQQLWDDAEQKSHKAQPKTFLSWLVEHWTKLIENLGDYVEKYVIILPEFITQQICEAVRPIIRSTSKFVRRQKTYRNLTHIHLQFFEDTYECVSKSSRTASWGNKQQQQ